MKIKNYLISLKNPADFYLPRILHKRKIEAAAFTSALRNFLLLTLILLLLSGCLFRVRPSELQRAEELSRQGKYDEAIEAYRNHMNERLRIEERPEWENPYFYLILIGDIELGTNKTDQALGTYLEAENQKVDTYLVTDRIRSVAKWHEDKGNIDRAIEILLAHRSKDSLLFEAMLDRLNKAKTLAEDKKRIQ